MSDYPILIARYDAKHPSDLAICVECKRESTLDPSSGDPHDMCLECKHCGGGVMWKYGEGDQCQNCGNLDWSLPRGRYCSRRCELQGEYAASLKAAQA